MLNTASIGKLAEVFLGAHGSKDEVLSYCEFVYNFLKFNFQTINKKRAPIRTPSQPTTCELGSTHSTRSNSYHYA